MREKLLLLQQEVIGKLKAFQRATVARIDRIFRDKDNPQYRVLVADEVGLGKTMIARGVIANMAVLRHEENDQLFKVVYVCSNQAIARQNIRKLQISADNKIDNSVAETRLSMQHLRAHRAGIWSHQGHRLQGRHRGGTRCRGDHREGGPRVCREVGRGPALHDHFMLPLIH